jgi:hypothetical protein
MALKSFVRQTLSRVVRPYGYEIVDRELLHEWQLPIRDAPELKRSPLPDGAAAYLDDGNPRLQELRERYAKCDDRVTTPFVWTNDLVSGDHLRWFREDHAYVWQLRGPNMNRLGYALTLYYAKSIDTLGLLDRMTDDTLFGSTVFQIGGRTISRDLLDSVIEIYFLERHLKIASLVGPRILDIGAGYGRLAHRVSEGLANVAEYLCVDGVAASTFISEYYLTFRNCRGATVVPLDEIDQTLSRRPVDVAVNVHSFSECRPAAVDWWLSLLERHRVKYLMIVPNAGRHGGRSLETNDGHDFGALVGRHGYKLVAREPKYLDPMVEEFGINPTYHFLFELR